MNVKFNVSWILEILYCSNKLGSIEKRIIKQRCPINSGIKFGVSGIEFN